MRIIDKKEIEELIKGHFSQFIASKDILDLLIKSQGIISEKKQVLPFIEKINQLKFFCFLTASFMDLLSTLKGFLNANTEWENIHFSKNGYLLIYEIIENYKENQNLIRNEINSTMPELGAIFKKNAKLLREFKKEFDYDTKIKFIRNKTSAHIDIDFLIYFKAISKISSDECIVAIETILGFLKVLMTIVHDLTLNTTLKEVSNEKHPNIEYWNIIREELKKPKFNKYIK